jgi:Xaa-Pro aminopeptidase
MSVDDRVARLREEAAAAGLDAVLVTSPPSIFYLTGLDAEPFERLYAVAVTASGGALIVPALDREGAERAPSGLDVVDYTAASDGFPELGGVLDGAQAIGVEEEHLSLARARRLQNGGAELRDAQSLVMGLRQRKDAEELDAIRHACTVVVDAMERMFARLRIGDIEREVNAQIAFELASAGATESHPLILFGPNASRPHDSPGDRPLTPGDVVCADVSARIDGYWADLTRCATAGPPSDWAQRAWTVVRDAQAAAIDVARVGATAQDVDAAQRAIVEGAPDLGACLHGAGHAVGTEIHEPPFLVPGRDAPLAAGHVLTIEPGLYAEGVGGIRLEDDVAVTDGDPALLSDMPLALRELRVDP